MNITYQKIIFEDDCTVIPEGSTEKLDIMMLPTQGICNIHGGLLLESYYRQPTNGHKNKTCLKREYLVHETVVSTDISLANGKKFTSIVFLPEHRLNSLIDCFRTIYRQNGEESLLSGKEG